MDAGRVQHGALGRVGGKWLLYYLRDDHLGRPEVETNQANQHVWLVANMAFDRHVQHDAIGGLNLGFPGQYFDAETGFWHNGFRDYDSRNGTYLQSDPIALAGGVNTYAYVGGNPVGLVDSLGLSARDVSEIRSRFHATVNLMTQQGLRDETPLVNNVQRYFGRLTRDLVGDSRKMDCGEQTDHVNKALSSGKYDDIWRFEMDAGTGHAWGIAISSNPSDPTLWYDARSNRFSEGIPCETCSGWFGESSTYPDYRH